MSYISIFLSAKQGELNNNKNQLMLDFQYFAVITGSQVHNLSTGSEKNNLLNVDPTSCTNTETTFANMPDHFVSQWPLSRY